MSMTPIRSTQFVRVVPTEEQYAEADERVRSEKAYRQSMRGIAAKQVGQLGEIVARDELHRRGVDYQHVGSTRCDGTIYGRTVDIKTKDRKVAPLVQYEASIWSHSKTHQTPDFYIFLSLEMSKNEQSDDIRRFHTAHLVGVADQHIVNTHQIFRQKGELDPSNGWEVRTDCWNLSHSVLIDFDQACDNWNDEAEFFGYQTWRRSA